MIVLITGVSSGIGRMVALRYLRQGEIAKIMQTMTRRYRLSRFPLVLHLLLLMLGVVPNAMRRVILQRLSDGLFRGDPRQRTTQHFAVESFFAPLTKRRLKRGVFCSVVRGP
jgi:hypothetical protein